VVPAEGAAGAGCGGTLAQATMSIPTIASPSHRKITPMLLLMLEALLALVVLVLIVWWTMFSGRPKGELPRTEDPAAKEPEER
jgi:hypothetical protein